MTIISTSSAKIAHDVPQTARRPHVVFSAAPFEGHTTPLTRIAEKLVRRGFPVTFIGAPRFGTAITATGARHVPIPSYVISAVDEEDSTPRAVPKMFYHLGHMLISKMEAQWQVLRRVLADLKAEDASKEVVVVSDTCFMGTVPLVQGCPLPEGFATRPKVVALQVMPYMATSIDTGPMGLGLPPDSSESGRMRNSLLHEMMVEGPFAGVTVQQNEVLCELGATAAPLDKTKAPFHHWMRIYDITLQLCPPSLEYPRSDMLPNVEFAGCPTPSESTKFVAPAWWHEVTRGDKRVVTVTQGTVATVYTDLVVPSIEALSGRDDLLVVAILGRRDAALPPEAAAAVPSNTRVIDYLPYDAILPHTAVFILNAGLGGFLHGVCNGVPMVLAGETQEKKENAMKGEWSGVGVNLRTGKPHSEAVRKAVETVLAEPRFKKRVLEIKRENEQMKVFDVVERKIMQFAS